MALLNSMNLRTSNLRRLRPGSVVPQQASHRICATEGCDTRLSRYNPATACSTHEGWDDAAPTPRTRRRGRD